MKVVRHEAGATSDGRRRVGLPRGRYRAGALVGLAMNVLMVSWVFSSGPFVGPDEAAHYLRALSISNGVLAGHREPFHGLYWPAHETAYVAHDNRAVTVPARLSPPSVQCVNGKPDVVGSCTEATYVGDYPPLPYLLPAVAIKASGNVGTAWWLTRLVSAVLNLGFMLLALALVVCSSASPLPLLGLLAAVTPMVFFVGSVISPNGLEIAANLAFFAGILWALRDPRDVPRWALVATAISGVAVVLAWSLGPAIVVIDVVVAALLCSRQRLRLLVTRHRRALAVTTLCLVLAGVVFLVYGKLSGLLHAGLQLHGILNAIWVGREQLSPVLHDAVGVFGGLTIRLPTPLYWLWWGLVLVLCAIAAARSPRRGRIAMVLTLLIALAFPVFFWAFYFRQVTGLQGRYILPILVLVPLVAGYLLGIDESPRAVAGRVQRFWVAGAVGLIATFQFAGWWVNARTFAGKTSAHWFLNHPLWTPPLGWLPWLLLAALGALSLLAVAGVELLGRPRSELVDDESAPTGRSRFVRELGRV